MTVRSIALASIAAVSLLSVVTPLGAADQVAAADQAAAAAEQAPRDPVGSWWVVVAPEGGPPPFHGLMTFDKQGGLIASAQGDILLDAPPGIAPVATAGHGAWRKLKRRTFLATFRQIFYGADGSFEGSARIRNQITLAASGNEWTANLQFEWFDADGQIVGEGEATAHAVRIFAEPLSP